MNEQKKDDIDDLLKELKSTKSLGSILPSKPVQGTNQPEITEDNINEFVMKRASLLVQQGIETSEDLKNALRDSCSSDDIESYSKLITSVATAIDVLNKINLQNKKDKAAKELKEMELSTAKLKEGNTTNILIASREEIMKSLFAKAEELPTVIDYTDIPDQAKTMKN